MIAILSARDSSLATLAGLAVSYAAYYLLGWPLATEAIGEWIMAETPSAWALLILDRLGAWAKPWALTGGLAALGFSLLAPAAAARARRSAWWLALILPVAALYYWRCEFPSPLTAFAFWIPAAAALFWLQRQPETRFHGGRRELLLQAAMASGTLAVAGEGYLRNEAVARRAVAATDLFPMRWPADTFGAGLVRKAITPVGRFYVMSKNSVDPILDAATWRLVIKIDGTTLRTFQYRDLLALPRKERYQTLRCISNTLKSDLMGTAYWSGFQLRQIVDRARLPEGIQECVVLGTDGHGDSFPVDYAFGGEFLLALGMNGKTLTRDHGYPLRLLVPRYYGFKNIKWIGEINFVSKPYLGTWPKRGFTKEPVIHTMSYIDRIVREPGANTLRAGGVAFAGVRGITRVEVRVDAGPWRPATLETPPYTGAEDFTWTRWTAAVDAPRSAEWLESRALDGSGKWQLAIEKPLFPDGVAGPYRRRIPV